MQVKVSEISGSRGQKAVVHSLAPNFQDMVLPLKQLIIAKRNTLVKNTAGSHEIN